MRQALKYTAEEREFSRTSRAKTPEQWLSLIDAVRERRGMEVAVCAAALVWWDWFGNHSWPHLNQYTKAWTPDMDPPPSEVIAALVECGYPRDVAARRVLDDPDIAAKRVKDGRGKETLEG